MNKRKREAALSWWYIQNFNEKRKHIEINKDKITGSLDRRPNDLTGREIEIIYTTFLEANPDYPQQ